MSKSSPGPRRLERRKAFCDRTKELREARGITQKEAATHLHVAYETYKKWETRNPMGAEYIDDFCFMVNADPTYLVTGIHRRERAQNIS